jgi:hypothetical protein
MRINFWIVLAALLALFVVARYLHQLFERALQGSDRPCSRAESGHALSLGNYVGLSISSHDLMQVAT